MINLDSLKYFYDSCRFESMTKAATLNHISRPAVSQAIKKLEGELGVELLNHKRRGFEMTRAGKLLMKQAMQTFSQLDETCSVIREASGKLHGSLRIGSARTLVTFEFKNVIKKFLGLHKDVDLKIRIYNSEELVKKLLERELDLVVFLGEETLEGHEQISIKKGQFCLIEPKRPSPSLSYALTESRPETVKLKSLYQKKHGKPLPVYAEIHSWDAIWNWVEEGHCGGLVPDFLLSAPTKNTKVVHKDIWPYEIKALYSSSRRSDPLITEFLKCF